MEKNTFLVPERAIHCRLDIFLSQEYPFLSRSKIKRFIEEENVLVEGAPSKASHHLKPGEEITVLILEPEKIETEPENVPLNILYEDDSILILNKPANIVVHPGAGNPSATLVNALLYHCEYLSTIGGELRQGIVHRLDKGTSGVMVIAKDNQAHQSLAVQFKEHKVKKKYLAFVWGNVEKDSGTIDIAIGRHAFNRKEISPVTKRGRMAVTHYRVMERFGYITLLELDLETGRTHQIRVHLSSIRYPVLGDPVYGKRRPPESLPKRVADSVKGLKRQALHASRLGFNHPVTNTYMEFTSPIPEDMDRLLKILRATT